MHKPAEFDVFTMGFSNRDWETTLQILQAYGIQRVVDIRTLPGSKYTPQFNKDHMEKALPEAGIDYVHLKSLGGLRKPSKTSIVNAAWRNDSFRGYADYMQTPEFDAAIDELIRLIQEKVSIYACTEAVFWRCHRQLVSDALIIRNFRVGHIFDATKAELHKLTSFASVAERKLTYP